MEKITAVVIDSEGSAIKALTTLLEKYCPLIRVVGKATTKSEGIAILNTLNPQLLFLDTKLEEGTGFDLLEEANYPETKLIFVTAFEEFAMKAVGYNAMGYVLKPIAIEALVLAVNRVYEAIEKEQYIARLERQQADEAAAHKELLSIIAVPSVERVDFIKMEDIIYLKSEGRYTIFNLKDKKQIVATKNLGEYESLLGGRAFFRIHNSYIVNLKQLRSINKVGGNYCEMSSGEAIPIAKRRQDEIYRFLKL